MDRLEEIEDLYASDRWEVGAKPPALDMALYHRVRM
jgi:hypothetical protein